MFKFVESAQSVCHFKMIIQIFKAFGVLLALVEYLE